jgi:aminoglycoside 3-N-acetyltransferase
MIKLIDKFLSSVFPSAHIFIKNKYNYFKKKYHPQLSKNEFIAIIKNDLKIETGDVVFVHSSMRKLYLDFSKGDILSILREIVGKEGTILFPCWQFNIRAEDYIINNEIVFSHKDSPSAMGKISESLRFNSETFRSFHPTNSVIAIGLRAHELTAGHEDDIYPCGIQSPFFKMMKYHAKVIGLGVTVDNLTFVHTVEDVLKEKFPIKTRMDKIFECNCIDKDGNKKIIKTLVASKAVSNRDVTGFFNREISPNLCVRKRIKGMDFFSLETASIFEKVKDCAFQNKTIYLD